MLVTTKCGYGSCLWLSLAFGVISVGAVAEVAAKLQSSKLGAVSVARSCLFLLHPVSSISLARRIGISYHEPDFKVR